MPFPFVRAATSREFGQLGVPGISAGFQDVQRADERVLIVTYVAGAAGDVGPGRVRTQRHVMSGRAAQGEVSTGVGQSAVTHAPCVGAETHEPFSWASRAVIGAKPSRLRPWRGRPRI
ncbi:hypothetical protein Mro03_50860 [Microbispora rosea subsp. rosea]|nr:hypothetical protein Mro03_50860 [Microbispora rosea subsp. rosea]